MADSRLCVWVAYVIEKKLLNEKSYLYSQEKENLYLLFVPAKGLKQPVNKMEQPGEMEEMTQTEEQDVYTTVLDIFREQVGGSIVLLNRIKPLSRQQTLQMYWLLSYCSFYCSTLFARVINDFSTLTNFATL